MLNGSSDERSPSVLSSNSSLTNLTSVPSTGGESQLSSADDCNDKTQHSDGSFSAHTLLRESHVEKELFDSSLSASDQIAPFGTGEAASRQISIEESVSYSQSQKDVLSDSRSLLALTATQVIEGVSANSTAISAANVWQDIDPNVIEHTCRQIKQGINNLLDIWEGPSATIDETTILMEEPSYFPFKHNQLTSFDLAEQEKLKTWMATQAHRRPRDINKTAAHKILKWELELQYRFQHLIKYMEALQEENEALRHDIRAVQNVATTAEAKLYDYEQNDREDLRHLREKIMDLEEELDNRPEGLVLGRDDKYASSILWQSAAKISNELESVEINELKKRIRELETSIANDKLQINELEQTLIEHGEIIDTLNKEAVTKTMDLQDAQRNITRLENEALSNNDHIKILSAIQDDLLKEKEALVAEFESLKARTSGPQPALQSLATMSWTLPADTKGPRKCRASSEVFLHIPRSQILTCSLTAMASLSLDVTPLNWSWTRPSILHLEGAKSRKFVRTQPEPLSITSDKTLNLEVQDAVSIEIRPTFSTPDRHSCVVTGPSVCIPQYDLSKPLQWTATCSLTVLHPQILLIPFRETVNTRKKWKQCNMGLISIKSRSLERNESREHSKTFNRGPLHSQNLNIKRTTEMFHLSILQVKNKPKKFSYLPGIAIEILQNTEAQITPINEYHSREISCVTTQQRQRNITVIPCCERGQLIKSSYSLLNNNIHAKNRNPLIANF